MLTFYEVKEDASLQDHTTFCSTSALIVSSFLDKDNSNTDAQEKEAMQSLIWSLIYEVKWTKQKSKHTPTALSSASKSWMMSWKEADKLMKSRLCFKRSPALREKPDARANTQCASPFYTVLKEMLPEVQGLERWCGLLEKGWKQHQEQQMFIISHTNAHAQCYWHISPDSHDDSQANSGRKLLASSQPLFSSNVLLSRLHPPYTAHIFPSCILPPSVSTSLGFPSFPSFLYAALCFYHLMLVVLFTWKGTGKDARREHETEQKQAK